MFVSVQAAALGRIDTFVDELTSSRTRLVRPRYLVSASTQTMPSPLASQCTEVLTGVALS